MSTTALWAILIVAVIVAAGIGFVVGRRQSPAHADLKRLEELHRQQLTAKQAELDAFREEMHEHYDRTAGLFVSMAGSYRELFDHLSEGYEKLGDLGLQKKLPERPGALLDGPEGIEPVTPQDLHGNRPDFSETDMHDARKDY